MSSALTHVVSRGPTPLLTLIPTVTPTPGPAPTPQPGGFGVSIDDDALLTDNPAVTVRAWAPNVKHMRLSDDDGFADSTWQTYRITTTWVLSACGSTVTPRVICVQFQGAGGAIYGTTATISHPRSIGLLTAYRASLDGALAKFRL